MKKINTILVISLLAIAGCGVDKQSNDDIILIDVTNSYPEKELIVQDFMDVEYIILEATDEFITQGNLKAIGKEIILVINRINDGDIFVFERKTGKGLRKINRKGQGNEEYIGISYIVLDENNNEMFIINNFVSIVKVYDLYGNFKRSFDILGNGDYMNIYNFDKNNLICYYSDHPIESKQVFHLVISKQDGSITKKIQLPSKGTPTVIGSNNVANPYIVPIVPYNDSWIISEPLSDTIYQYFPDGKMNPVIVKTPSVYSTGTEILTGLTLITNRYYFIQTQRREYDFETGRGFPITDLAYDKEDKSIFRYTFYNGDFTTKKKLSLLRQNLNKDIAFYYTLDAFQLIEANEKQELKGQLKEVAEKLDEDDNPVLMLLKYRK
jgi:hypothetical protein